MPSNAGSKNFSSAVSSFFAIDTCCTSSDGKHTIIMNIPSTRTLLVQYSSIIDTQQSALHVYAHDDCRQKMALVCTYMHGERYEAEERRQMTADCGIRALYIRSSTIPGREQVAACAWCIWCIDQCRQQRTTGTRRHVLLTAGLSAALRESHCRAALLLLSGTSEEHSCSSTVSYTHLTLPTTPYV